MGGCGLSAARYHFGVLAAAQAVVALAASQRYVLPPVRVRLKNFPDFDVVETVYASAATLLTVETAETLPSSASDGSMATRRAVVIVVGVV